MLLDGRAPTSRHRHTSHTGGHRDHRDRRSQLPALDTAATRAAPRQRHLKPHEQRHATDYGHRHARPAPGIFPASYSDGIGPTHAQRPARHPHDSRRRSIRARPTTSSKAPSSPKSPHPRARARYPAAQAKAHAHPIRGVIISALLGVKMRCAASCRRDRYRSQRGPDPRHRYRRPGASSCAPMTPP